MKQFKNPNRPLCTLLLHILILFTYHFWQAHLRDENRAIFHASSLHAPRKKDKLVWLSSTTAMYHYVLLLKILDVLLPFWRQKLSMFLNWNLAHIGGSCHKKIVLLILHSSSCWDSRTQSIVYNSYQKFASQISMFHANKRIKFNFKMSARVCCP